MLSSFSLKIASFAVGASIVTGIYLYQKAKIAGLKQDIIIQQTNINNLKHGLEEAKSFNDILLSKRDQDQKTILTLSSDYAVIQNKNLELQASLTTVRDKIDSKALKSLHDIEVIRRAARRGINATNSYIVKQTLSPPTPIPDPLP